MKREIRNVLCNVSLTVTKGTHVVLLKVSLDNAASARESLDVTAPWWSLSSLPALPTEA